MQSLISVNKKFMELNPKELANLISSSKYTKGLEICIDYEDEFERKYLKDLVFELKKNNLILQVHGNSDLPINKQIAYMQELEEYANYLNQKIVVTLHSIYDEEKEKSLKLTNEYLKELTTNINNNKIIISLENLNDVTNMDRLEKEYILPLILKDKRIYFTYDIGHELIDYGNMTNLEKKEVEEIRNIHIHTHDDRGNDHQPIYKNDKHWNELMKGLIFLINNKYNYGIVYEYDLYKCRGENIKEKISDYLSSIDYISEHYTNN